MLAPSLTTPIGTPEASTDLISIINQLTRSELKKLTPNQINEIISKSGEKAPSLNKHDYQILGKRFHIIPSRSSVHLYRWAIDRIASENITTTINSMKRGCLTKLIKADFRTQKKMFRDKFFWGYLKSQHKAFKKSVKQELYISYHNPSELEKIFQTIREKYGEDNRKSFESFIETRSTRLARLACSIVYFNKAQREKLQIASFFNVLDHAQEADEINQKLKWVYAQVKEIKNNEAENLLAPNNFQYVSHFSHEDRQKIRTLIRNDQLTPYEKRGVLRAYLEEIESNLDAFISKADDRIKLLGHTRDPKKSEFLVDRFKKCISDIEAPYYQEGIDILTECSQLEALIGTRDAFLFKIDALSQNILALQKLEADLNSIALRTKNLKNKALRRSEAFRNDESAHYLVEFLTKHRFKAKLTIRSASLIQHYADKQNHNQLSNRKLIELNVMRRFELCSLLQNSLSNQISLKFKQVISPSSDKPPMKRNESDWGIHQKITWQLKLLRERIQQLSPPSIPIAGSSQDDQKSIEDEKIDIITKISGWGINPQRLTEAPFNLSKPLYDDPVQEILPVDWNVYAQTFMSIGITYRLIENIRSAEEFILWYKAKFCPSTL